MIVKQAYCTECGYSWTVIDDFDARCEECDSRSVEVRYVNRAPSIIKRYRDE